MFLVAALPAARAQIFPVSLVHDSTADSKIPSGVTLARLPPLPREVRRAVKPPLPKSFWVLSSGVNTAAGLNMQRSDSMLPNFDERDPVVRPFFAPARAGVLRFGSIVRYGNQLCRMENGAVRALAQNLVGSAGLFDGRVPGGIWIHARASVTAWNWRGAKICFAKILTAISC